MPVTLARAGWLAFGASLVAGTAAGAEPTKTQCIAANESAQDLRSAGKLIEARVQLAVCVAETCPGPVRQDCAARIADIDKAQPTLVLVAKDAAGNDLGDVHATIDGKPLAAGINGTAIPLDPGEHRVVLEAAGLPPADKTLVLHEGEKGRREILVFETGGAPAPAETGEPPSETAAVPPPAPPGHTQRMIGLAAGGVGAAGLVLGGVFALVAKSTYDHARQTECDNTTVCTTHGASDVQSAYTQATVATVGMVAGAVLLGAGAALYLTAPRAGDVSVSPAVGSGAAGLSLRGVW